MHTQMVRRIFSAFLFGACLATLVAWAGEELAMEDCGRCGNTGYEHCFACGGTGVSRNAMVTCPVCDGAGELDCNECNEEGKIKCRKCRMRVIEVKGKTKRAPAVINPAWRKWYKDWGPHARITDFSKRPEEPEKYVLCIFCEGTGWRTCPECGGDKKKECKRCKGEGETRGLGPCPDCKGYGKAPCQLCARLDGIEDYTAYQTLEQCRKEKILDAKAYYGTLRTLVWEIKNGQRSFQDDWQRGQDLLVAKENGELVADAGKTLGEKELEKRTTGKTTPDTKPTAEESTAAAAVMAKYDEHGREVKKLGDYVANLGKGAALKDYRHRVRDLGLPDEAVGEMESACAGENKRVQEYVQLKQAFRNGEIDYDEYRQAIGDL